MQNKVNITPIPWNVMSKFQEFLIKSSTFYFIGADIIRYNLIAILYGEWCLFLNIIAKVLMFFFVKGNVTTAFYHRGREFLLINLPSIEN